MVGSDNWERKGAVVKAITDQARSDTNGLHFYRCSWNISSLFGGGIHGSPLGYSPFDAVVGLLPHINELYTPDHIGKHRIGQVNFDFYDRFPGVIANIIHSNEGCEYL